MIRKRLTSSRLGLPYVLVLFALALFTLAFCALLGRALAMSSDNYRLDWLCPLTGGGGGPAASTHYAVNLTVGQSALGASSSTNYGVGLGYWYGTIEYRIYLPLVVRAP